MVGLLHLLLLLCLLRGPFLVISAGPDGDTTTVDSTLTTTRSLFITGSKAPTTGSTAGYSESTTKPPESSTTTEHLSGDTGRRAEKQRSRKDTREEEGPVELGEKVFKVSTLLLSPRGNVYLEPTSDLRQSKAFWDHFTRVSTVPDRILKTA